MRVLVTGGAGFIGSHIVEHYSTNGHEVKAVDNLDTGLLENLPKGIECLPEAALKESVEWAELIFHAAAVVGMRNVIEHPAYTMSNNLFSMQTLLNALSAKHHLIYLSSSGVYWNSPLESDGTFHEETELIVRSQDYVQEAYSLSKLTCEVLALTAAKERGFRLTIPRIFNTVGVRQTGKYGMVVPRFVQQALYNEPLTIYGDGKQTRSFINVHDTVEALSLLVECPKANMEIVNVGNDREITIEELAQIVIEVTGSKSKIKYVPYKEVFGFDFRDARNRRPCIDKLKKLTGFSPVWTLEQTIAEIATANYTTQTRRREAC